MTTQEDVAVHLDIGPRHVRRLTADGVLPRPDKAADWNLDACRVAYLRYLRDASMRHGGDGGLDLVAQKALESKERTERDRMENVATRAELIHWRDVAPVLESYVVMIRDRMMRGREKMRRCISGFTKDDITTVARLHDDVLSEFAEELRSLCPPEPEESGAKPGGEQEDR